MNDQILIFHTMTLRRKMKPKEPKKFANSFGFNIEIIGIGNSKI